MTGRKVKYHPKANLSKQSLIMQQYQIKDSGKHQQFSTGMIRDSAEKSVMI